MFFWMIFGSLCSCSEPEVIELEEERLGPVPCRTVELLRITEDTTIDADGWTISVESLLPELNKYGTCAWESDGSISEFSLSYTTDETDVMVFLTEDHSGKGGYCSPFISFRIAMQILSEVEEERPALNLNARMDNNFFSAGGAYFSYGYLGIPPSGSEEPEEFYLMSIRAYGDILTGDIESVSIRAHKTKNGARTGESEEAICYKD